MTRLMVMSDSHGDLTTLRNLVEKAWKLYPGSIDAYIHLGDGASQFSDIQLLFASRDPRARFYSLRGNCDWSSDVNEEAVIMLGGKRIFACHGHRYRVKGGLTLLSYVAQERGCDMALYGHTHIYDMDTLGGVVMINPGAACEGSLCIVEWDEKGEIQLHRIRDSY